MTFYKVIVLREGYSKTENGQYKANGTSTLVVGPEYSVIVDTLSPWDKDDLLSALSDQGVSPGEITHVVNTHTHPDHCGNNNLFTGDNVLHIIGCTVHCKDVYFLEPNLEGGEELLTNQRRARALMEAVEKTEGKKTASEKSYERLIEKLFIFVKFLRITCQQGTAEWTGSPSP